MSCTNEFAIYGVHLAFWATFGITRIVVRKLGNRSVEPASTSVAQGQTDGALLVQHERQCGHLESLLPAGRYAARLKTPVHPNDHVNMSQSSNDTSQLGLMPSQLGLMPA